MTDSDNEDNIDSDIHELDISEPNEMGVINKQTEDIDIFLNPTFYQSLNTVLSDIQSTTEKYPSLLPLHRGPSSINWPIIGGATKTGLTIFYPNDGLDEGEILLQKEVEIDKYC